MRLRFLGKESTPDESPTLYATDQDSYVVQGWIVTDKAILARHDVPDDETLVEVPPSLFNHLVADGLTGEVAHVLPPIVDIASNGNFIVQGARISDLATLGQMGIPDHETCVHVLRSALVEVLAEV